MKRIGVVINPAAGQDRPVLGTMNRVFHAAGVDWDVFVTKRAGDAGRYARDAIAEGYDAVGVYGGDGTVGEVASAMVGAETPLAIFPGGTANVMAVELGIPSDTAQALALAVDAAAEQRLVDVGEVDLEPGEGDGGARGTRRFLLRVGFGFEAQMVEGADRELKDRLGPVAYALSALQTLRDPPMAHYRLTVDGEAVESRGITCIVANSGSLGRPGLTLAPGIDVGDGRLDVIVIRQADLGALLAVAASVLRGTADAAPLQRWQGREVTLVEEPPQAVTVDGEIVPVEPGRPLTVRVVPRALRVIVPAGTGAGGAGGGAGGGAAPAADAGAPGGAGAAGRGGR
jgi:diacylglycerol kinase (ATP)